MTRSELKQQYFEWMIRLVYYHDISKKYSKLLCHLNEVDFTYKLLLDENRAMDGINLRYRFGIEKDIPQPEIATMLDDRPCSVLEMLVALCFRVEEQITYDAEIGNRTGMWFWGMIENLGLLYSDDYRYSKEYVDDVIFRFLNRQYDSDGRGGLFFIRHPKKDLRDVEIWYQFQWYLNENL